jgi:hypothetical protein
VELRRRPKINPAKADTKGKWKNHGIASQRREKAPSPKSYRYTEGPEDDATTTPAAQAANLQKVDSQKSGEGESERRSPGDGASPRDENGYDEEEALEEEKHRRPDPVQILDLHSNTPMVSYRGHVFSCEWTSNTGTELLFTARDHKSQLPVLRALRGEVDLLAASSCRLISKTVTLEPKFSARNRMATDLPTRFETRHSSSASSIPVGPGASQKRKDQARFLERLMAIKQKKGEEDEITVIAQKRQLNNKWKLIWRKKRQAERLRLVRLIGDKAKAPISSEEVEKAKQKLQEMDCEDGVQSSQVPMTGGGYESMAHRSGRKRKAPSNARQVGTRTATSATSTPTIDVEVDNELDENMEQDLMESEDTDDGEEETLYDEDDPGDGVYY